MVRHWCCNSSIAHSASRMECVLCHSDNSCTHDHNNFTTTSVSLPHEGIHSPCSRKSSNRKEQMWLSVACGRKKLHMSTTRLKSKSRQSPHASSDLHWSSPVRQLDFPHASSCPHVHLHDHCLRPESHVGLHHTTNSSHKSVYHFLQTLAHKKVHKNCEICCQCAQCSLSVQPRTQGFALRLVECESNAVKYVFL